MSRTERRAAQRKQAKLAKKGLQCDLLGNRAWVAAVALAAYSCTGFNSHALAASALDATPKTQTAVTLPLRRFDIAAGPLDVALAAFAKTSGLGLHIDLPAGVASGFNSKGVTGLYTSAEALRLLLAGTGLQGVIQPALTPSSLPVALIGLRREDTVSVTAPVSDSVSMAKFSQPLLDTPQTVAVVPQFVLHDEQNTTLRDALRNVPGISLAAGEFGAQGDNLTIRGFTARNDIFLDGIRDFGSYYRDSFDYDQVEVLEGPAGVQFGRGSTGGVINQESKVPAATPFVNVQTQFGTDATRRLQLDINTPTDSIVPGSAFRVAAVGVEAGVAGRPFVENRHYGVSPSLAFGLNSATHGSIAYFHFQENDTPDYGLPWLWNKLAPANRHAYFGFPNNNDLRSDVDIVTGRIDRQFTPSLSISSIGRWANYARDAQITEPQICSNATIAVPVGGYVSALPTNAVTGLTCTYTAATPASQIAVNRNQLQVRSVEGDLWDQTTFGARFKLFGIRNEFSGGFEGGQEISNPVRTSYTIKTGSLSLNSVPSTNLANPNPADAFSGSGYISSITHTKSDSLGLFFVDTVHLSRLFDLSGGVRWDYFDTHFNLYAPPTAVVGAVLTAAIPPILQIVAQPTYRAAFVYKPTDHGSIYFDYGTSFNPSAESLSLSVATSVLPPEENETYETGAKYNFLRGRLMLDGAWFRTTKLNARETDPNNSSNIVLAGNQLVRGVQASAVGRLAGGMDIVLGYAYLHSAVTYSKLFPTSIGYPLANVPQQTFNAFVTRTLIARFKGGFGGNYVASRTASSTVPYIPLTFGPAQTFAAGSAPCGTATTTTCYQVLSVSGLKQVPGYWVFNASLSRSINDHIEFQANVYNLLNRFYIDEPHSSHLIPGAGLSALIGANFHF